MTRSRGLILHEALLGLTTAFFLVTLSVSLLPALGKGTRLMEQKLLAERTAALLTSAQGQALVENTSLYEACVTSRLVTVTEKRSGRPVLSVYPLPTDPLLTGPGKISFTAQGAVKPAGRKILICPQEDNFSQKGFYFEPVRGRLCYVRNP
jgi:hypothetical protein